MNGTCHTLLTSISQGFQPAQKALKFGTFARHVLKCQHWQLSCTYIWCRSRLSKAARSCTGLAAAESWCIACSLCSAQEHTLPCPRTHATVNELVAPLKAATACMSTAQDPGNQQCYLVVGVTELLGCQVHQQKQPDASRHVSTQSKQRLRSPGAKPNF